MKNLNVKINKLVELNSRYIAFMCKFPAVVQRLNSALKLHEIIPSVIELVNDVVITERVEYYLYDPSDDLLKKISADGSIQQNQHSYALGENLVGAAAKHRFLMVRDHFHKYPSPSGNNDAFAHFEMAVPVLFKENLLGVIGIGEIKDPTGNEPDLLKMIADIAGVALRNQIIFDEAQQKANTDPLTGLRNRNYFFEKAQLLVDKSLREGSVISIFLFDIDNFKHYNDTNGHDAGDKLLVSLSSLIYGATRKECTIVRYGGEEFIVMLPGIGKEDAFHYAERLRENIARYPFPNREKQPLGFVSISGGIATFPEDGNSIHEVIQCADKALYQAKAQSKNRTLLYRLIPPEKQEGIDDLNTASKPLP